MSAVTDKPVSPPEEQSTKFRPSENFKHMKKYLRWKFEHSSPETSNDYPPSITPTSSPGDEEKVKPLTEIQPPLPTYSPPPGVYIKEEIDSTDYEHREAEPCSDINQPEFNFNTAIAEPRETMCRNFVRGTCKNEYTCKFAHKIIKDQLRMVYSFCKEFQNKGCSLQDCRYVHCTVFEQEEFYRTGKLPSYATQHIKQRQPRSQKVIHPEDQYYEVPQQQILPPQPSMNTSYETSNTSATTVPGGYSYPYTNGTEMPHYGQSGYQYEPVPSTSSTKRPWTDDHHVLQLQQQVMPPQPTMNNSFEMGATVDEPTGSSSAPYTFGTDSLHCGQNGYQYEPVPSTSSNQQPWTSDPYTQRDLDFRELLIKKCEDCEKNEFRFDFYNNKAQEMASDVAEIKQNANQLNEKTERLIRILQSIGIPVDFLKDENFTLSK